MAGVFLYQLIKEVLFLAPGSSAVEASSSVGS